MRQFWKLANECFEMAAGWLWRTGQTQGAVARAAGGTVLPWPVGHDDRGLRGVIAYGDGRDAEGRGPGRLMVSRASSGYRRTA